jgi:hypothetical protein
MKSEHFLYFEMFNLPLIFLKNESLLTRRSYETGQKNTKMLVAFELLMQLQRNLPQTCVFLFQICHQIANSCN